jgi:hypothetical protein
VVEREPQRRREKRRAQRGFPSPISLCGLLSLLCASAVCLFGCSTHQCDASSADAAGGQVTEIDGTWTWQTSSLQSGWIPFNPNETIRFTLPSDFPPTSTPGFTLQAYVSTIDAGQTPEAGGEFVEAAGQLAEFANVTEHSFTVFNDTCAGYYLRVVASVTVAPTPVDAGADAPHD